MQTAWGRKVLVLSLFLGLSIGLPRMAGSEESEGENESLRAEVAVLREAVRVLQEKVEAIRGGPVTGLARHVRIEEGELEGLKGPHVIFEGVNVHVRSGSGYTNDNGPRRENKGPLKGLGNLVIGYNEVPHYGFRLKPGDRSGSHNLVMGEGNRFRSYSGFVHGWENTVSKEHSATVAGDTNHVAAVNSAVIAGWKNRIDDVSSVICGGRHNLSSGMESTIVGGEQNVAAGRLSAVVGGAGNRAEGHGSVIAGGKGVTVEEAYGIGSQLSGAEHEGKEDKEPSERRENKE